MDKCFVLTDLPSDEGAIVTSRTRRCRGCARCISTDSGRCVIDDDLSPEMTEAFSCRTLEIHTGISDSEFSMPMRKAVERLANILQSYTDAGGNIPLDSDSVELRNIQVIVHGSGVDPEFESYAKDLLLKGPVRNIDFRYGL